MTTVQDVLSFMEAFAPITLPPSEDNVGLLVGRRAQLVNTLMVTLDITRPVIEEAAAQGVNLLVAHHPITFGLRAVTGDHMAGDILLLLAEHRMAAICMHQNWDAATGGVNDCLADAVGLSDAATLTAGHMGRVGTLPTPIPPAELAQRIKARLNCGVIRLSQSAPLSRKIAVGSGSSGALFSDVLRHGCDTFVTADIKHHQFIDACALGLNVIDAGHFTTENLVMPVLAAKLASAFPGVEIVCSKSCRQPYSFY